MIINKKRDDKLKKSIVIVISGMTASGKTTLIRAMHDKLPDSAVISYDDYSIDALPSAPPINQPLSETVDQYDLSSLMKDFLKVKDLYDYILLDFPFGYKHLTLRPYIDKVIYVKTPLDVCFARQVIRDYHDKTINDVLDWSKTYLNFARPIFLDYENFIGSEVDLTVDGMLPIDQKVALINNLLN